MSATLARRLADAGLDWIVPEWDAPADVGALFTTRNGPGGAPFDVGPARLPDDDAARVRVLGDRAVVEAFLPAPPVYLEQVHGVTVASVARSDPGGRWPVADAAVTRAPGVPIAVRAADCLPVLFTDALGEVVAAAHAGWRGLAAGVLEATVAAMRAAPASIVVWIGPGIGPRRFEVGDDVLDAFVARDPDARAHFAPHAPGKWLADLPALAQRRLRALGIARIAASGLCTASDAARFHSYRRDRGAGRLAAYVWRAGDAPPPRAPEAR